MRVVFHSGGVFILLGWFGGSRKSILSDWAAGGKEEEREKRGRRPPGGEAGLAYFLVLAAGNGFSKYSGKVVSAGRNRPRFAIRAHCGLLVTSVSPNCCFFERNIKKISFPCAKQLRKYASPASPPDGLLPLFSLSSSFPPAAQSDNIDFRCCWPGRN